MKPRGIRSRWLKVTNTYTCEKRQPSRSAELNAALRTEHLANGPLVLGHETVDYRDIP